MQDSPAGRTLREGRRIHILRARGKSLELGRVTRTMGVVNVTPDSFSDGGEYLAPGRAIDRCLELAAQGADILDIGGESTRPGVEPVSASEELDRVLPVLEGIRGRTSCLISIDTYKSEVARSTLEAGAHIVNNVGALQLDPAVAGAAEQVGAAIVLMHMRGTPKTMQALPPSRDILKEIEVDLGRAADHCRNHGIPHDRIVVDPGIGFGKTVEDNLRILHRLSWLRSLGSPILVGTSRKSFLGKILEAPVRERLLATAASVVMAVVGGAHIVRVHDLAEMSQALRIADSILGERRTG
jgi:dihydropteroate synthase